MNRRCLVYSSMLIIIFLGIISCDKNISGSATETGNVTGTIVSTKSKPVVGAKVVLFKKKTTISSPDDSTMPVEEVYSDSKGMFDLDVDDGSYTIVASSESKYAFVDNIIPGTDDATDMTVTLRNPGEIKGEITNSLELRGTESVIVHLIGTDVYLNVDNNGTFYLENIPPGTYTLVSYSSYQPEFIPDYREVAVYSDSCTDLGEYALRYSGIPIPKNIAVVYDTALQTVTVSWSAIDEYKDFQEYAILRGVAGQSSHDLEQVGYTTDTFFVDSISFSSEDPAMYEYSVRVTNKLGEEGLYYGIYSVVVTPYLTVLPKVDTLEIDFDTLDGTVHLEWDSVETMDDFGGYLIVRTLETMTDNNDDDSSRIDTLGYVKKMAFVDTLYEKVLSFDDLRSYRVMYSVCVYQKEWELHGRRTASPGMIISSYKTYKPIVSAGEDQQVDIHTEVQLEGTVDSITWPVAVMEWKIGDDDWIESEDGTAEFTSSETFTPETTICVFKVTDSVGNIGSDTVHIIKSSLLITYSSPVPGRHEGTRTTSLGYFNGKFRAVGFISDKKFAVWSSNDLNTWDVENASPGIENGGFFLEFENALYLLNLSKEYHTCSSYRSEDGKNWDKLNVTYKTFPVDDSILSGRRTSNYLNFDNKIYAVMVVRLKTDQPYESDYESYLLYSNDGVVWNIQDEPLQLGTAQWYNDYDDYHYKGMYLFSFSDTMFLRNSNEFYMSSDRGLSWEECAQWDTDYVDLRDECIRFAAGNSAAFAYFKENPGDEKKVAIFSNNEWVVYPEEYFNFQNMKHGYKYQWIQDNRLYVINEDGNVTSFKIY